MSKNVNYWSEADAGSDAESAAVLNTPMIVDVIDNIQRFKRVNPINMNNLEQNLIGKSRLYYEKYMSKNKLEIFYEEFKSLDDIINLFFVSYAKLTRSSFLCSSLWIEVMKIRIIMINSITHLIDQPHTLSIDYSEVKKEQLTVVRAANVQVAKAVHYIIIFKRNNEAWQFF